jgi:hypothetical protein
MTNTKIEIGAKLNLKLNAVLSVGRSEENSVLTWEVGCVKYHDHDGSVDYFTFKGKKTEFRICGNNIYSITGPRREYKIL